MHNNDTILDVSVESPQVSLEAVLYDVFYRQRGIRRMAQLDNPVISEMGQAVLPKFSIYHYNPENPLLFGPLENNPWYINDKSLRFIQHVSEFSEAPIGTAIRKPGQVQQYVSAYRRKHRTLRLLRDFFGVNRNGQMLMVVNYSFLNHLWKYRPHRFVNYYKFINFYKTITTNMDKLAAQSDRQQYFEVRLPEVILPRAQLRILSKEYEKGLNSKHLNHFKTDDDWLLLHLWMWVGNQQHLSIFNKIQPNHLNKINILLTDRGRYVLLNLGKLNEWRAYIEEGTDEEGNLVEIEETDTNVSERLQVKFYKLLNLFASTRTGTAVKEIVIPTYTEDDFKDDEESASDDIEETETPIEVTHGDTPPEKKVDSDKLKEEIGKFIKGEKTEEEKQKEIEQVVQKKKSRLKEFPVDEPLETIPTVDEDEEPIQVIEEDPLTLFEEPEELPTAFTEELEVQDPMKEAILEDALELVEAGAMTAKQYERIKEKAQVYKTVPSPYFENETIEQTMVVTSDMVNNVEKRKLRDNKWVLDKSMLEVSTEEVRAKYIKEILPRNITQSIMGLQKGGVLVTDIQREEFIDPTNHYEILSVKVQPIDGVETTMKIKLPIVNENGEIINFNSRYYLRSQRHDFPLRKVSPTKVSLTTYYGKLFITKSDKRVFNLEKYYINNIQAKMFDGIVSEIKYGNVFDKSLQNVHPNYQMISTKFKEFTFRDKDNRTWYLSFDYHHRDALFKGNKEKVGLLENKLNGTLFAVDSTGKEALFIDNTTGLVYSSNENLAPRTLENFLEITQSPPIECAEIKVFSKSIPIVILLGYYLGLSKLCKLLNVKPRKVFRGQRLNLLDTEYEIKFGDETWVFDKRDYKAQLILNGFNQYKRYIVDYSAQQFEDKDVYIAVLRDAGIPVSYETEFKLMRRMFIDDISKLLLEQKNEPTTFIPLLIRAVELLTKLHSNDEVNMEDMVISGYERIAGHVYSELVRNLKALQNNRSIAARKRYDLPPTHILQTIMKDPSMSLVDDINPIHNLKEHENVTFNGTGGRTNRSMVARTRAYHETDLGTISEATVDNASVGVVTYLSANPNINSLYGTTKWIEEADKTKSANILSTSGAFYPASDTDDQQK